MSSVGSFFSYVNDARSHEPEARLVALEGCSFTETRIKLQSVSCWSPVLKGCTVATWKRADRNLKSGCPRSKRRAEGGPWFDSTATAQRYV